jgi:UDP-N-acetylmuramoyl-L-alanyl-D-glutamate--2,6-diaminopimelate ligase
VSHDLATLAAGLPGTEVHGNGAVEVQSIAHDSRHVSPGALFVAIRGLKADGNQFIDAALKKGAVAVASEEPPRPDVPWLRVPSARIALASLAARLLDHPAQKLELVGVTGTNGKTTTTYLIDAALRAAGHSVGFLGTVQYRLGHQLMEAVRTTPESSDLQGLFAEMVKAGCRYAVLEVSSHALALERVYDCDFRCAVFTNLTRDHLDFHGDMDRYFVAKRHLFDTLLRPDGHAVINLDDPRAEELRRVTRGRVWTYSQRGPADLSAERVELSTQHTRLLARTPAGAFEIETPLLGRFNVHNLLAALGAALALEVPVESAIHGLVSVGGVPGRLEQIRAGQDFSVIVDYAHTDDALRSLLETVHELGPRRVLTVFGCGGDRDRSKRPLMGAVAARLSDVVVVTSDNPRSEPPEAIIAEILRGMNGGRQGAERFVIEDRREAIAKAISLAGPGDAVVIAGKGHETTQTLRDRTLPFDDRQVARAALGQLSPVGRKG